MRQYFNFSTLISDFSNEFTVICTSGQYGSDGNWTGGEPKEMVMSGAIIGFRQNKIFRSDGAITAKDKHLFMQEKLPDALVGAKVRFRDNEYMIESETENAEFTGVYSYVLRWCSAFDTEK